MPQPVVQTAEGPEDGRERRAWSSAGGPYVFVGDGIRVRARADKIRMRVYIVVVDVRSNVREQPAADLVGTAVENDEIDRHVVLQQKRADGVHRRAQRLLLRVPVNAGGDQRERHRLAMVLPCQRKARPVAGNELLLFAVIAALPHRADGVNDIFAGQAVSPRELGLAGPAPAESPAFSQQLRPGRPVDAAVHAASAEQRLVGCIDNGVHAHSRDVVSNDNKRHDSAPAFDIFQARNAARPDRIWIAILYQLRLENARKHRKRAEVFREAWLRGLRFSATIRKTKGSSDMSRTENVELTVVCLLEDGGRVLLQNRKKEEWHGWALPGGHVEPGESFVDAVSREMQEETGLTIRHPRLVGVKQFPIEAGRYVVLLFKAVEWSGTLTSSEEGEMAWIEYSKLPSLQTVDDLEEMLHMMNTPELTEFQYLLRGDEWIASIK